MRRRPDLVVVSLVAIVQIAVMASPATSQVVSPVLPINADKVDGFDASSTPVAGRLLPLDGNATFPLRVLAPCAVGQVPKFGSAGWDCGTDATGLAYSAGSGLLLSGTTFSANLTASGGDNGTAGTVARGDHGHDARYYTKPQLDAVGVINTAGNPVEWTKLKSVPAGFADGTDNDTTYAAGNGLLLSGTTFSANMGVLQSRVSGACPSGNAISTVNADGTVVCQATGASYSAGAGLVLSGTQFSANLTASGGDNGTAGTVARGDHGHDARYYTKPQLDAVGVINTVGNPVEWTKLKSVPAGFADGTDNDTTYTAAGPLTLTGTSFGLRTCSTGEILRYTSTGWACGAAPTGGTATDLDCTGCVEAIEIADGAVGTQHVRAGSISADKLATSQAAFVDRQRTLRHLTIGSDPPMSMRVAVEATGPGAVFVLVNGAEADRLDVGPVRAGLPALMTRPIRVSEGDEIEIIARADPTMTVTSLDIEWACRGCIIPEELGFDPATQAELDALAAPGTINAASNPVHWTKLRGVPQGFADGVDNSGYDRPVFSTSSVDSIGTGDTQMAMTVGADGLPFIAYLTSGVLKAVHCTSLTCSTTDAPITLDTTGAGGVAVAIGADGFPFVAYYATVQQDLKAIHCTSVTCGSRDAALALATTGDVGKFPSVAIGPAGGPLIAYYNASVNNGDLNVIRCTNAACTTRDAPVVADAGLAAGDNVGSHSSLVIGRDGLPVIAHHDLSNGELRVVKCTTANCSSTVRTTLAAGTPGLGVGQYSSIALAGPDLLPVIAFYDADSRDLMVVHCANAECTTRDTLKTIATAGDVGTYASVAVSGDGLPVVTAIDATTQQLKAFRCSTASCQAAPIANPIDTGDRAGSVMFGADGFPLVVYQAPSGAMKVVHCSSVTCVPFQRSR